jgi:AAA15 family ATPase/GTPase
MVGNVLNKAILPHKDDIITLLSLFDDNIVGFDSAIDKNGRRMNEYINHKIHGIIPLYVFGDGLKRALILASYIINARNGVLLIDEIDTSIHKSILPDIFKWLVAACKKFNVQVFATTHNLEALSNMITITAEDEAVDFVVYKIENVDGNFYSKRYSEEKLTYLVNEVGQDIR